MAAVENLNGALNLVVPAHDAVQLALLGLAGQGDAVVFQELALGGLGRARGLFLFAAPGAGALLGRLRPEELAQEGEGGGAPLVLLLVGVLRAVLGQLLQTLDAAEGGHHLMGERVQVLVGDAHFLHHVVHRLEPQFPGAFQAEALIFGLAVFNFRDKDHCHVLMAASTKCRLHG